jgi:hypothetical protein
MLPQDILIDLASKIVCETTIWIAKKSYPVVEKHVKITACKAVEIIDEGWLKDYYAGGISAQFNKNNTESA